VVLVRADVGRLPFATGSLPAVHAGAAIHCWPNPQLAFAEISRVLAPGGVFVASTFLAPGAPLGQLLGNDDLVRPLNQVGPQGSWLPGCVSQTGAEVLVCTCAWAGCLCGGRSFAAGAAVRYSSW
jgi:ubiquinone/menaquinone biosynthesis C-methylase UbiE